MQSYAEQVLRLATNEQDYLAASAACDRVKGQFLNRNLGFAAGLGRAFSLARMKPPPRLKRQASRPNGNLEAGRADQRRRLQFPTRRPCARIVRGRMEEAKRD